MSQIGDHWELVSANGEFVLDYETTLQFLL